MTSAPVLHVGKIGPTKERKIQNIVQKTSNSVKDPKSRFALRPAVYGKSSENIKPTTGLPRTMIILQCREESQKAVVINLFVFLNNVLISKSKIP